MTNPLQSFDLWLDKLFIGLGLTLSAIVVVEAILGVLALAILVLVVDILLVWIERKVVARFQDRLGPNRLGPFGLFQPFADVLKLLIKENLMPKGADRFLFNLSPIIALATVLLLWAVIPLAPDLVGAQIDVGVLYIVAIGAISTLGIIIAGWASNNKYALLGAFRTVAQMVSYEVPMVIALMVPVLLVGSMNIYDIVEKQTIPFFFIAPVAALILLVTSIAELGRAPFDMVEAESEIVAGFHIEYSGMKFGMFYAGELLHALTIGALFATFFLGGWKGPFVEQVPILGVFYLFIKALFIYWVIMWIKYSLPRLRIDHMLNFNWKFLTPLAIVLVMVMAVLQKVLVDAAPWIYFLAMLAANLIILWIALTMVRVLFKQERRRVSEVKPIASPGAPPAQSSSAGD
jgi:NADH-quinone oxidoreductase subunit H